MWLDAVEDYGIFLAQVLVLVVEVVSTFYLRKVVEKDITMEKLRKIPIQPVEEPKYREMKWLEMLLEPSCLPHKEEEDIHECK